MKIKNMIILFCSAVQLLFSISAQNVFAENDDLSNESNVFMELIEESVDYLAENERWIDYYANYKYIVSDITEYINSNLSTNDNQYVINCTNSIFQEEELLDADIEALIEERQAARKAKNFARADEIRNQLAEQGIILKDTREGVKWTRA